MIPVTAQPFNQASERQLRHRRSPMGRWYAFLPIVAALVLWAVIGGRPAFAQDGEVGFVRTLDGEVIVRRDDGEIVPALGDTLFEDDVVETGGDGAIGITLRDSSLLSLGPNTRFHLEDFAFDPIDQNYSFIGNILQGTFVFITGELGILAPDSIRLNTPVGFIGVRGTRIAASVGEP